MTTRWIPGAALTAAALVLGGLALAQEGREPARERLVGPGAPAPALAEVGEPAPDFSLLDLDGARHELSRLRGRVVVLEWFNADCPYVAKYHRSGLVRAMVRELRPRGVTWLAIASGISAASADDLGAAAREWSIAYPILRDRDGAIARAYRARRTPHMYVIDRDGVLRYEGALDDAPDDLTSLGERNHVLRAVGAVLDGREVEVAHTTPFGTTVSLLEVLNEDEE